MTSTEHYKVIIVGGGPAGLGTALHLAQRCPSLAEDLLVIEAKEYPRPKLCGGGITIHGEEQLQNLGIQLDVPSFYVDRMIFRLGDRDFQVPHQNAMRVIQRLEFDAALADCAIGMGLNVHTGERLLDLQPTENGVIVITDHARYHATVLIGADGANSTVRRKLRLFSTEGVARLLRVLTPIDDPQDPLWQERAVVFDFSCIQRGVQGYMWNFPCYVDGQPYMNRGIFDSRITPQTEKPPHGTLKRTMAAWVAQNGIDMDSVPLQGHPVRWFTPNAEFSRPHVLLAGDAAGVDALFAEGISYAMEYGAIIADTLEDAFQRQDFSFNDYRQRLVSHRLGKLLMRRAWVASTLYEHRYPHLWSLIWRLADIAPKPLQQVVGRSLALLPA